MTWSMRRQVIYASILIAFLVIVGTIILYPKLNKPPTCTDRKQNGDELGVDCGGACALACLQVVEPISILWSRAFQVVPGRYNVVAYLENKNKNAVVQKIHYRFRFAEKDN